MKKLLLIILTCCLLLTCCCAIAEDSEQESFLMRIYNRSGIDCRYLRFDVIGDGELRTQIRCSPKEGEDFFRVEIPSSIVWERIMPEEIQIVGYFCYSDPEPGDAMLKAMMDEEADEQECLEMKLDPVVGMEADYELVSKGENVYELRVIE